MLILLIIVKIIYILIPELNFFTVIKEREDFGIKNNVRLKYWENARLNGRMQRLIVLILSEAVVDYYAIMFIRINFKISKRLVFP